MPPASPKPPSPDVRPNVLAAIPYCDKKVLAELRAQGESVRFLLDSGAFTAWKSGKEVLLNDYCKFIENLPFRPFGYFTLDKIGDARGTRRNFDEITRRGLNPIPIFTRGSDWSELDDWFGTGTPFVGVGGGTGTRGFPLFIRDVSRRVEGTGRRVHWLGFTDKDFIARWRPFSCDSSSVNNAIKYHNLMTYNWNGSLCFTHHSRFREDPVSALSRVRDFVEWAGEDLYRLRDDGEWRTNGVADIISCKAWAAYAIEAERRFGTKLFFALVNADQIRNTLSAWWYCADRLIK